jgi:hypothetical protein
MPRPVGPIPARAGCPSSLLVRPGLAVIPADTDMPPRNEPGQTLQPTFESYCSPYGIRRTRV